MKNTKKDNITHLNTYSINKTLENIRNYKRQKLVRLRTTGIVLCGALLIGLASMPIVNNRTATEKFETQHVQAQETLAELEHDKAELEYQVGLLEDEEFVAKLARKELNLSKPNEILINLPAAAEDETETDSESEETTENEQ